MSYKFGQFRKNQLQSYLTPITKTIDEVEVQSALSSDVTFIDKVITPEEMLTALDNNGKIKSYYLRFKIYKRTDSDQTITVRLVNTNLTEDNTQNIRKVKIEKGASIDYSTFEIVFSPNDVHTYNQIYFELDREIIDYNIINDDDTKGRKIDLVVERLDDIYNVINYIDGSIEDTGVLKQIGVQSAPGLLMSINGEEIKVGRSGIYEINNGIKVSFIGFIVEDDSKYFVLD